MWGHKELRPKGSLREGPGVKEFQGVLQFRNCHVIGGQLCLSCQLSQFPPFGWHPSHLGKDRHSSSFAKAGISRAESQKGFLKVEKISDSGTWQALGLEKDKFLECPSWYLEPSKVREKGLPTHMQYEVNSPFMEDHLAISWEITNVHSLWFTHRTEPC